MVGCPGCGSKLVFSIENQQMKCSYCGKLYPISSVAGKSKDADESIMENDGELEVTMFTCSQCGAEIMADPDEAVTWCSFCGSPATLKSRLCRIRKPDSIIPFQITKERCVKKYLEAAKKQIYAPRDLLKQGKADGFRGIYMPYWTYTFDREGKFAVPGKTVEYEGDYRTVTNYLAEGSLKSHYEGLSHDASASFDDSISEQIAPYFVNDEVPFEECYMNGFYGDAADQNEKEYENKMFQVENDLVLREMVDRFSGCGIDESSTKMQLSGKQMSVVKASSTLNMYPVWFMSYRNKDRVSYATVNGQTGRMCADFPASPKRFIAISAIIALPIFFLLYFLTTPSPSAVLFIAMLAVWLMSSFYKKEVEDIYTRRFHIQFRKKKQKKSKGIGNDIFRVAVAPIVLPIIFVLLVLVDSGSVEAMNILVGLDYIGHWLVILFGIFLSIIMLVRFIKMQNRFVAMSGIYMMQTNLFYLVIAVISTAVYVLNPVQDWVYYSVALSIVGLLCVSVISLIRGYNILSSVQPKQFKRSGGDGDNA